MNFDTRPSPARVSAAAAVRLPRWALWLLLLSYGLVGLFGREPWYQDDAASFGVMWTMATGSSADWLIPNVQGLPVLNEGPLHYWFGALCIQLLAPLFAPATAARLSCLLWFFAATAAIWYATYRYARQEEAQPLAFVFGGEASPRDYGRMLADVATLLFLGTVGLALPMHELTAESAAVAPVAAVLFGLAYALERPRVGAAIAGAGCAALALMRGLTPAALLLIASFAGLWLSAAQRKMQREAWIGIALAALIAVAGFALWPLLALALHPDQARAFFGVWYLDTVAGPSLPQFAELVRLLRNLPWFTWPIWPLAAWAVYSWRHRLGAPHIALPALIFLLLLSRTLFLNPSDMAALLLFVPPLVVLAAFGATTLRRAAESAMDWLSIALFSLLALTVWAYYIAFQTGFPPKMYTSIARLTTGFQPQVEPLGLGLALLAAVGWVALLWWRVRRNPPMLWRGAVLAAAGTVMLWVTLNGLFLPTVDYSRSHAGLARIVAGELTRLGGSDACVQMHRMQPAHRALFAYFGKLKFAAPDGSSECGWALHRDSRRTQLDDDAPPGDWQLVWQGNWPTRSDETWRLYRRGMN